MAENNLMDDMLPWPICKRLGDATRDDLKEAIRIYRREAQKALREASHLRSLAARLPDDKTTIEEITEQLGSGRVGSPRAKQAIKPD
jgi:hypothetical protein